MKLFRYFFLYQRHLLWKLIISRNYYIGNKLVLEFEFEFIFALTIWLIENSLRLLSLGS